MEHIHKSCLNKTFHDSINPRCCGTFVVRHINVPRKRHPLSGTYLPVRVTPMGPNRPRGSSGTRTSALGAQCSTEAERTVVQRGSYHWKRSSSHPVFSPMFSPMFHNGYGPDSRRNVEFLSKWLISTLCWLVSRVRVLLQPVELAARV